MPKKTDLSLPGTGRLQKANRLHIHHLEGLECLDCLDLDCDQKKRAPLDQSAGRLAIRMPTRYPHADTRVLFSFTTCLQSL